MIIYYFFRLFFPFFVFLTCMGIPHYCKWATFINKEETLFRIALFIFLFILLYIITTMYFLIFCLNEIFAWSLGQTIEKLFLLIHKRSHTGFYLFDCNDVFYVLYKIASIFRWFLREEPFNRKITKFWIK